MFVSYVWNIISHRWYMWGYKNVYGVCVPISGVCVPVCPVSH